MPIRIFIIEDHEELRDALAMLVELEPDLELCGMVEDAEDALRALPDAVPDVVLVDLSLPGMSGLELIERLQQKQPGLPVVAISGHPPQRYSRAALGAGAGAYLDKKSLTAETLRATIRQAMGTP